MSSYTAPQTQNPIFDPEAFVLRSIPDSSASSDVTSLTNQGNIAYNTAKTINLALSQSSVVNVAYTNITSCSVNTYYTPFTTSLAAGSYVISGNILVDATNNPNWSTIYLFGIINGEDPEQGIQFSNNSSQNGGMLKVYVPFSFYFAPVGGSTATMPFSITMTLWGGTGTYTIGPAIGADISICRIIGPNPYLGYLPII